MTGRERRDLIARLRAVAGIERAGGMANTADLLEAAANELESLSHEVSLYRKEVVPMYGGAGCYPSQYLGQADAEAEDRRQQIAETVESLVTVRDEVPDWLA